METQFYSSLRQAVRLRTPACTVSSHSSFCQTMWQAILRHSPVFNAKPTGRLEHYLPHASIRAAADLTGCGDGLEDRRSARSEMEARRLGQVPDLRGLQFRPRQVWRTQISRLEEASGTAFTCHRLAEKLAGDDGLRGRRGFHLRFRQAQGQAAACTEHAGGGSSPSCGETGDRDSTRAQVWLPQSQARINLVPGRSEPTPKRFRTCCVGPTLQSCSGSTRTREMDKRMEAQAKMIEAMGLNEKTARGLIQ
jgi:hypothetical protein